MSDLALAVVLDDYDLGPRLRELMVAPPEPGEILVETEAATVCGTDVHIASGVFSRLARLPLVMGHEGCGRVIECGAGVSSDAAGAPLRAGDRIVWAHNWCGTCFYCAVARQPTLCDKTMGYGWGPYRRRINGTFSQYLHVSAQSRVLRVPRSVSSRLASSSTCALRTVMHAFNRLGGLRFGHTVAVLGSGPVGLYAAAAAHAAGVHQTVLIGAPADRLAAARRWGLAEIIDIEHVSASERIERVRDLTVGRGADVVLECAGPASAFTESIDMVRKGGTVMVIGQAHSQLVPVDTTGIKVRQLTVNTTLSADISHFHDALRFLERHNIAFDFDRVMTSNTYGLHETGAALDAMRSASEMKPVIDPRRHAEQSKVV